MPIIDGIGASEMLYIFISAAGTDIRLGATGKAIPGYRAAVLDKNGERCAPGVVGRLALKGPTGCRYLVDERQKEYVANGWNITGDARRRGQLCTSQPARSPLMNRGKLFKQTEPLLGTRKVTRGTVIFL